MNTIIGFISVDKNSRNKFLGVMFNILITALSQRFFHKENKERGLLMYVTSITNKNISNMGLDADD